MTTPNNKKPKTIFDLIEGQNIGSERSTERDMTLEQALKQVDDHFGGDPEMKRNIIEGYQHRREVPTKQKP